MANATPKKRFGQQQDSPNSGRGFALGIPAAIRRFTLRIEQHAKGEVFTVERTEQDGRSSSDSTTRPLLFPLRTGERSRPLRIG